MKPQTVPSAQEVLAGLVERVTYHNAENGFCVLRAKARGHRDLVTVVGHAAAIAAGEWITASGEWVNDRTHGQQFKSRFMRTSAPTSIEGIEKYLGSGMIRGIGPVYARKMVRAFGEKVMKIRDVNTYRLEAALVEPFAYSQAWYERRGALLVEIVGDDGLSGWGEAFGRGLVFIISLRSKTQPTRLQATRRDSPSFVQISLCRVGHIACRFRSARGVRTPICTSDDGNSAEILGSRDEPEYLCLAREGIKTLAHSWLEITRAGCAVTSSRRGRGLRSRTSVRRQARDRLNAGRRETGV